MARPTRQGIDYFPYDVDLDQDDKLGMIIAEFKSKGELLFIKICAWLYKTNGYYTEWDDDAQLRFLRRYDYCGFSVSFIQEVVPRLIKWGLFDKAVFDSFGILTSVRIQETWLDATRKRKERIIDHRIWLLVVSSGSKAEETPITSGSYPQSKVKESKENESRVETPPEKNIYGEIELCFDVENLLLNNKILLDSLCAKHGKNEDTGLFVLKKYHLSLIENEKYPRSKKALYAGFEKWLMGEKTQNHAKSGTKQVGKNFISD